MARTTPRHTAAQYVAHELAAKKFVECLNAYNDIMARIAATKQNVLNARTWATDAEFVDYVGEVITDPSNDFMLADYDAFVVACEAEYPKHGVVIAESGLVPEHEAFNAMANSRAALIKVVCEIADINMNTIMSASIIKQNEFATLACKAVGINVEIKL